MAPDPTLRTEYWDDLPAREAFKAFMVDIHGLDFGAWETAGYWDHAYTPFSYFDGDRVVASVCLYLLDAVLDGRKTRVLQISGVGTRPELRRRGLNRELTEIGLERMAGRHEGVFLFSDEDAVPFYARCGFTPIEEFVEVAPVPSVRPREGLVKLDPGRTADRDLIHDRARRRAPISNRFAVMNPRLVMFHALYTLRQRAYAVPELDCVVFFARENGVFRLFDVLAEEIPPLDALYPYVADDSDERIELHFPADLVAPGSTTLEPLTGNLPFVRGAFPVDPAVFPFTARA